MKARVLPVEEWAKLDGINGLPQLLRWVPTFDAEVIVIEDGERIIATTGIFRTTHLEGCWIDPEYRGNAGVARRLLREVTKAAKRFPAHFAVAQCDGEMGEYLDRMGAKQSPGRSYVFRVEA